MAMDRGATEVEISGKALRSLADGSLTGIVVLSTGSWYRVREKNGSEVECRIRGKIRLKGARTTNPVVVGDVVEYIFDETGQAIITEILPRKNYIIRKASNLSKESHIIASNIDQAFIVVTLYSPTTSFEFIDRFLVTCEAYRIPATIILNKIDLAEKSPEQLDEFCNVYTSAGYPIIEVSATEGRNIDTLKNLLKDKTTLMSGNSGVGKSSLIRAVEPRLDIRIGEVSTSHNKGKHTTTFSQMFPLSFGGDIIDSPGIKGFGLIDIEPEEVSHFFPEIMAVSADCQFSNCTHLHEPGCAVEEAVVSGRISVNRYESYLKILDEDGKYRK